MSRVSVGGFVGGFTAALQKFGIGRLATLLGVAAGVSAVLVALMLRVGAEPDALLYSNLDLTEASEIGAALQQAGIKYSSKGDGSTIFVSRDEVGTARLMLAGNGMVTSGSVGYELFDNSRCWARPSSNRTSTNSAPCKASWRVPSCR